MADSVKDYFASLEERIDTRQTAGMNATYQFNITGDEGGEWYVKLSNGQPTVAEGASPDPSITMTASAADWMDIVGGKLNGQTAFLTGKLKIQGDMALAMKLQSLVG